jgi:hypothetical protein
MKKKDYSSDKIEPLEKKKNNLLTKYLKDQYTKNELM